jgi:hypothetical protein
MTDRQDAVVDMYQETDRFFLSEAEKVAINAILKTHSGEFHTIVVDIARFVLAQEFDSKGFASKKQTAKAKLSDNIFKLTSSFCSFGVDTKNQPIVEEFKVSETHVNKKKDAEFVIYANRLIVALGEYVKKLAPYHITAKNISILTRLTQAYSDLLHVPEEVIKDKAISTEKIKELISQGHELLVNSIDRDMIYYEDTDEPLYREYLKRREIHDANTTAMSIKGKVTAGDAEIEVLDYVQVTVKTNNSEYVTNTSSKGNYQFKGLPEGKCKVIFKKNYYDTLVVDSEVHSDKVTKLDVKMTKIIKD